MTPLHEGIRALYVHIPFCERRCEYCDFASVGGLQGEAEYMAALGDELRAMAAALPGVELDTVFVGGGTPGLIPPDHLAAVLEEVRAGFRLTPGAEVTIEANPSSTSAGRAEAWRRAGVTRVSVGVQSLHAPTLRFLGRVHGPDRALGALAEVRSAGFERLSADLIYAVPGLGDDAWRATLEAILAFDPGHVSCYELTVEPGTPLERSVARGQTPTVDPETALRQHWLAVELGRAAGYTQYEVSNLARPGHACRHNLAYWGNRHYLAAGVGAHAHLPPKAAAALGIIGSGAGALPADCVAVRAWHPRRPIEYRRRVGTGRPFEGWEPVGAAAAEAERIMLGLRLGGGVRLRGRAAADEAERLAADGLVQWDGAVVRTTPRGQEMLNAVALRIVTAATPAPRHRRRGHDDLDGGDEPLGVGAIGGAEAAHSAQ